MKTTIDIPADVLRQIKIRAAHEGKRLKDLVTDLLRQALTHRPPTPKVRKLKRKDLPMLRGGHPAPPGQEMTPQRVAEILYGSGEL